MPPSLTSFQNKVAEIAKDYEVLFVQCLSLEAEIFAVRQGTCQSQLLGNAQISKLLQTGTEAADVKDLTAFPREDTPPQHPMSAHTKEFLESTVLHREETLPKHPQDPRSTAPRPISPIVAWQGQNSCYDQVAPCDGQPSLSNHVCNAAGHVSIAPEAVPAEESSLRKSADESASPPKDSSLQQASLSPVSTSPEKAGQRKRVSAVVASATEDIWTDLCTVQDQGQHSDSRKTCVVKPWILKAWILFSRRLLAGESDREWKIDPVWEANLKRGRQGSNECLIQALVHGHHESMVDRGRCIFLRNILPPIHPNSTRKLFWDAFSLFVVFHDFITLPMGVFGEDEEMDVLPGIKFWVAGFWSLDILLSFCTGFYSKGGFVEMRFCRIFEHYLLTTFPTDASLTVLDWALIGIEMGHLSSFSGIIRLIFRGLRGLRLFRLLKGMQRLSMLVENFCSEYVIVGMDVAKLMVIVFLASHYMACLWYGLTQLAWTGILAPRTWAQTRLSGEHDADTYYAYFTSLHWALTQFTPASMEVVPENAAERAFACGVILTALIVFSSFVSGITQAMTHLRQFHNEQLRQECQIRKFLRQRNVSNDITVQIFRFVRRHKLTESTLVKEADVPIFLQLPSHLKVEMRNQVFKPILAAHPFFLLQEQCERKTMNAVCSRCLREVHVAAGTEAIVAEEEVREMLFVMRGMLGYESKYESCTIYVKLGGWACELVLYANGVSLSGSMLGCDRGAELIFLNATGFRKSFKTHSISFNFLASYAIRFVKLFRELEDTRIQRQSLGKGAQDDDTNLPEDVLFNNHGILHGLIEDACTNHPMHGMTYRRITRKAASVKDRTLLRRMCPRFNIRGD